ncbi:hypothetical protein [Streptomyces sp. NPDC005244]|uniref:hypothetical protein n=1 Tax=Streptomyces sp. NPDC005244 TaxID=3364708 RepID=UPI00367F3544
MAKKTPASGALNVAAMPPAAPQATRSFSLVAGCGVGRLGQVERGDGTAERGAADPDEQERRTLPAAPGRPQAARHGVLRPGPPRRRGVVACGEIVEFTQVFVVARATTADARMIAEQVLGRGRW